MDWKENNQELIVVLLTFDTDEKTGGDGGVNPNATYTNWQWHLVKTKDKKNWEIISLGLLIDSGLMNSCGILEMVK